MINYDDVTKGKKYLTNIEIGHKFIITHTEYG